MGKRSNFDRIEKDFYRTIDSRAVAALAPHVPRGSWFAEPCYGQGDLTESLRGIGLIPGWLSDIEPNPHEQFDALGLSEWQLDGGCDYIITNPPWSRPILHPMIDQFSALRPTWLLFDADWAHTKQSAPYMSRCVKIVSVGRLIWIPGTTMSGKDNCAWYLFDANHTGGTEFVGRG